MTWKEIEDLLKKTSALRTEREAAASLIGSTPEGLRTLLEIIASDNSEIQIKGCWVTELIIIEHPEYLSTCRELFFSALKSTTRSSAIRPLAKIIALWSAATFSATRDSFPVLKPEESHHLAECCFSWLLEEQPVAVRVYSMEALFHLGKNIPWIHPELKAHLLGSFPLAPPGFKARAKKILKQL